MAPPKYWYLVSGQRVRLYNLKAGGDHPIHGAYESGDEWHLCAWTQEGKHIEGATSNLDLKGFEKLIGGGK